MGPHRGAAGVVAVPGDAVRPRTATVLAIAVTAGAAGSARGDDPTKPAPAAAADEDGAPRLSLPTEADRQAWQRSGFRLGLGIGYGELVGLRGVPSGRSIAAKLRVGLRLDQQWSLYTSFEYARVSASGGLSGLRFAGTIDPTWHVLPSLSVALGVGFGGIVEARSTGRMDAAPFAPDLETSYTFPDASPPIARCSGIGAAGLARVEWGYVVGPRSQLTASAEAIGQWTGCVDETNRFEPDTGKAIVRRQWWPHAGAMLAVGVTWR